MRNKIIVLALVAVLFLASLPYYFFIKNTLKISILRTIFSFGAIKKIDKKTNFLILGIPGGKHDGPTLSDSIIFVTYNFKNNRLVTVGIPRDIWSNQLKDKINTAYAYGEAKSLGGGLKLAKAEVTNLLNSPIQYAAVINFSHFEELIDFFGGVKINVERSFTDKKYPKEGKENDTCGGKDPDFSCRYETIEFQKGETLMNGETALKYARSRNAEGDEGSDFARSKRQQKLLNAIRSYSIRTVLSLNLNKIKRLYELLDKSIYRDISNQQIAILLKDMIIKGGPNQEDIALPREYFDVPSVYVYGKYVLIPKNSEQLHAAVECLSEKSSKNCF